MNRIIETISGFFERLGGWALLLWETARQAVRRPFEVNLWIKELDHLGVDSLSIVTITALFTGMVLALQTAYALEEFGVKTYIGEIVSIALVRELGPVLTALMVGGRVGAGITAELGTMAVTEQVDAMRALGTSPIKKLVVPKVLAVTFMLPVLTVLADFLGIMGGLFIAVYELKMSAFFYLNHLITSVTFADIFSGIGKTAFFGLFISSIGCYNGLGAKGGADGVGRATTRTVVAASISVLISDFFLTKLFLVFF